MRWSPLLLLLAAATTAQDDPHRLQPDHAPTPFTAEQIRKGCPDGRVSTFLIKRGEQVIRQTFRFSKPDEEGATLKVSVADKEGKAIGEPKVSRVKWLELQGHASYLEKLTTIEEGRITTGDGTFDCLVYVVKAPKAELRFHFAKLLPGPPVRLVQISPDGTEIMSMELIDHRDGTERALLLKMGARPMTDERRARYEKQFDELDKNRDGKLDLMESLFRKPLDGDSFPNPPAFGDGEPEDGLTKAEFLRIQPIADDATRVFLSMDKDGDKKVTLDEFLAGCGIEDAEVAQRTFSRFQVLADGPLSPILFRLAWEGWAE